MNLGLVLLIPDFTWTIHTLQQKSQLSMEVHPKLWTPLDSPWHPSEHCPRGLDVTSLFIDNPKSMKRAFLNTLWYISFPCVYICLISHNNENIFMSGQPLSVLVHFPRSFSPSSIPHPCPILSNLCSSTAVLSCTLASALPSLQPLRFLIFSKTLFFSCQFFLSEPTYFIERSSHRTEEICL